MRQIAKKAMYAGKLFAVLFLFISATAVLFGNTANAKKLTSADVARKAALREVKGATVVKVEMDTEDGISVYDVELIKGKREYNLTYRISDGTLLEYEWDIENTSYSLQKKPNVSEKKIRNKALNKVKGGKITSIRLETDDGLSEYKVVLKKGTRRYQLEYNAKNAELLGYDWKIVSSGATSSQYIGKAAAEKIALKKVPGATIIKNEFDKDDGVAVYEIEMRKGRYEYDIKINAKTGKILEFEKDIDD